MGLAIAVNKFDIDKGTKFSTYATYWITQTIMRSIYANKSRFDVPEYFSRMVILLTKAINEEENKLGRKMTGKEIMHKFNMSYENYTNYLRVVQPIASTEQPVGEEDDCTLGDFIVDENCSLEDHVINNMMKQDVQSLLDILSEKEKMIIKLRYGLNDDTKEMTLREIGEVVNLTGSRVGQIEEKILLKLRKESRKNNRNEELRLYLR